MFIGLLIILGIAAYFLFYNKGNYNIQFPNRKSAEEILKERYVNGEIDEETYKKMKEIIKQ